jgi:VanZ family protein
MRAKSPLALYLLLGYTLLILYASLSPFSGWRDPGIAGTAFLTESLPRYVSAFDVAVNVLAYVPFGFLVALAAGGFMNRRWAALCGVVTGVGFSIGMEIAQGFLPGRVSNNLDVIANGCGALSGALLCARAGASSYLAQRLLHWRADWIRDGGSADLGLALIGLWFFSQLDPSLPLLGIVFFSDGVQAQLAGLAADDTSKQLGPLSVGLNLAALGFFLMLVMRSNRIALIALVVLVWIAALIKLIAATVLLRSEAAFLWVSQGVVAGLAAGAVAVLALAALPRRWIYRAAGATLTGMIVLALLRPEASASFLTLRLFRFSYVQLLHYTGLAAAVAECWPYAALVCTYFLGRRERKLGT